MAQGNTNRIFALFSGMLTVDGGRTTLDRVSVSTESPPSNFQRMRIQAEHHADLEQRLEVFISSVYILLFDEIRDQWELIMFSAANAHRLATQRHDLARSAQSRQ